MDISAVLRCPCVLLRLVEKAERENLRDTRHDHGDLSFAGWIPFRSLGILKWRQLCSDGRVIHRIVRVLLHGTVFHKVIDRSVRQRKKATGLDSQEGGKAKPPRIMRVAAPS